MPTEKTPGPRQEKIARDIKKIKDNAVDISKENPLYDIGIEFGSKRLKIGLDKERRLIKTYIEKDEKKPSISGETELLYRTVKSIIQKMVDKFGKPTTYSFETRNIKMILWATSTGREMFSWDKSPELDTETLESKLKRGIEKTEKSVFFEKTFYPKNK